MVCNGLKKNKAIITKENKDFERKFKRIKNVNVHNTLENTVPHGKNQTETERNKTSSGAE